MKERGLFLTILLMAELCLAFTAGLFPSALVRRVLVAAALTVPLLLFPRAPQGTPRIRLLPEGRRAWLLLIYLPIFLLLVSGVAAAWGWLADCMGIPLTRAVPMDTLPAALLLDALLPAVCEELFCRGAVYAVLRPLGHRTAIPASALIFALMHANAAQIPHALMAGVCLALLYEAGGLLLPILFHLSCNAVSLLLLFGAPPLPVYLTLAAAAVIALAVRILLWRRVPPAIPQKEPPVPGAWRSLLLSPLALWLILILTLTVL